MKYRFIVVRRLNLTDLELRVLIDALNARLLKQKDKRIDNTVTSNLILRLLDELEA